MTKQCTKCHLIKDETEFFRCEKAVSGLQSQCKKCKATAVTAYYKAHPEKKHKRTKEVSLRKYYAHAVHQNIARLLRRSFSNNKSKSTFDTLGYSLCDLKAHLESLWQPGMTWENYGLYGWHIDHVVPRAKLPFTSETDENFKRCWALTNLQPLWAKDNLRKGDS